MNLFNTVFLKNCMGLLLVGAAIFAPVGKARILKWGNSSWNQARLLPVGEQRLSLKLQSYRSTKEFDSGGSISEAGQPYSYKTSFQDLINKSEDNRGLKIRSMLEQEGINENTTVFTTEFSLETTEVQTELSWSRSLTEWWMVGVNLPYIQSSTKIKTTQKFSPEYLKLKDRLSKNKVQGDSVDSFVNQQKDNVTGFQLDENNYDQVNGTMEYRGLGDVELLSQIKLLEAGRFYGSLRQRLVVPTGENEGPYTYIKSNSADGQMDIGLDALVDFQASRSWVLTGVLGYTVQMEDTQASRVPDGTSSQINWGVDDNVERDLGDVFIARLHSVYRFLEKYWMTAGVEVTQKALDTYSGGKFEDWQYDLMGKNSEEQRQLARLGLKYSSDSWRYNYFSKSQLSAGLEYLTIFAGRNTPQADAAALEISLSY